MSNSMIWKARTDLRESKGGELAGCVGGVQVGRLGALPNFA